MQIYWFYMQREKNFLLENLLGETENFMQNVSLSDLINLSDTQKSKN